jgi:hypothetical protein
MELLSVAELLETGYRIPARIDDPNSGIKTFGRPGNGDGYICGKPLGNQMVNGLQLYMFFDNQLPASR